MFIVVLHYKNVFSVCVMMFDTIYPFRKYGEFKFGLRNCPGCITGLFQLLFFPADNERFLCAMTQDARLLMLGIRVQLLNKKVTPHPSTLAG